LPLSCRSTPEAAERAREVRARADRRREQIEKLYRYDLLRRNCATELARALAEAFPGAASEVRALGDVVSADTPGAFAPLGLWRIATRRLDVRATRELASYRQRALARESKNDVRAISALREATTLTTSVAGLSERDGAFLFFSDRPVPLRPVFGVLNLAYGLGTAGAGMLTSPLDGGAIAARGLRGALYSVPELLFLSLRKGRYLYAPERWITTNEGGGSERAVGETPGTGGLD
jgi:hypothetical protein